MIASKPNIYKITDEPNAEIPASKRNYLVRSSIKKFEGHKSDSGLSLKMVVNGAEHYRLNHYACSLKPGEFLLVEPGQEVSVSINAQQKVEGFCLYMDENYFRQALSLNCKGPGWSMENPSESAAQTDGLLTKKYSLNSSAFGRYLSRQMQLIRSEEWNYLSDDFFLQLADELAQHQSVEFRQLNSLSNVKLSTRKALYSKVCDAKEYIDQQCIDATIEIKEIAAHIAFSEIQLFRTFKQVFGLSPYQYILQRKLLRSKEMIEQDQLVLQEVSLLVGFSDLSSFSKAFKRKFGYPPSSLQAKN